MGNSAWRRKRRHAAWPHPVCRRPTRGRTGPTPSFSPLLRLVRTSCISLFLCRPSSARTAGDLTRCTTSTTVVYYVDTTSLCLGDASLKRWRSAHHLGLPWFSCLPRRARLQGTPKHVYLLVPTVLSTAPSSVVELPRVHYLLSSSFLVRRPYRLVFSALPFLLYLVSYLFHLSLFFSRSSLLQNQLYAERSLR